MNKDKELYRHIYNFVKLREMNLPSAYEYQEKYGLRFIEEDVEEAFFKGGIVNGSRGMSSARGYNSILLDLYLIVYLLLELYDVVPKTKAGVVVLLIVSIAAFYFADYFLDHIACSLKTDHLYLVHMNSLNGGQRDDRY